MKFCTIAAALALAVSAQNVNLGSTSVSISCAGNGSDDCTKSDLVVRTKGDRTVLLRQIYACQRVAQMLKISEDIASAECFK
jgi:hypothetical protein